jgi:DNA replication protein DnaC
MDQQIIQQATQGIHSTSINPEQEPWILTPQEEMRAIQHAIVSYAKALPLRKDGPDNRLEVAKKHFTAEHLKQVLAQANSNKHQQLWHDQQKQMRKEEAERKLNELKQKCDANYFFRLIRSNAIENGKELIKTADTFSYLQVLCYFFSGDKRFETELGLNLYKGLWIRGEPGRGKTFPLQCLQNNELAPFNLHSMLHIANEVAGNGIYEINEPLKVIDDVGSEQAIVNHYGTKINWFKDFIEIYYAEQNILSGAFSRMIITTNLGFDKIGELYGFRVRSRVKDMFNVIDVRGEDLRGK